MILRAVIIGGLSGLVLSGWMYLWQKITGIKVYTLLLNVDFIPFFKHVDWNGFMLNVFHIIISWAIVGIYLLVNNIDSWSKWGTAFALSIGAACVYFPLSVLANQPVPAIDNLQAISIWYAGHLLYGFLIVKLTDLFYNSKF